jgi:hypothetical protein
VHVQSSASSSSHWTSQSSKHLSSHSTSAA